jgi:hypothetical protein
MDGESMTNDSILERLRAANPSRTETTSNEALFAAIVGADVSLDANDEIAPRRPLRRRLQVVVVAAIALAIGVGTAWATGRDVLQLFDSNPAAGDPNGQPASGLWRQVAIPSTVRSPGVLSIPHFGRVELWFAETRQHGWCGALRLPDGSWGGTKDSSAGGTAPGCYPSRTQVNAAGDKPVFVISGLDYYDVDVDARDHGGTYWRVLYGVTEVEQPVVRVVDTVSGRSAPILSGRFFAIAVPDPNPEQASPTPLWHFVAYGRDGKIIADADKPLKTP